MIYQETILSESVWVSSLSTKTILIPDSLNPGLDVIAFQGSGVSDKIACTMDLTMRCIPTWPRFSTDHSSHYWQRGYHHFKDRFVIWFGVAILFVLHLLNFLGYRNFWISESLLRLAGG
jgi:hypothetical protein